MKRRAPWVIAGLVLVAGVAFLLGRYRASQEQQVPPEVGSPEIDVIPEEIETETVELFFPGEGDRLYPEAREVPVSVSVEKRIRVTVEALLAGPLTDGLRPPLPDGIKVLAVHFLESRATVVLDLGLAEGETPSTTGSMREMLSFYSLVNTVTANFPQVERLQLLWDGRQPETFAGHLDTSRPLGPNRSLQAPPVS